MKLNLKTLVVDAKTATCKFPFEVCKGMEVELAYADRKQLDNIREVSLVQKFDPETGAPFKELDTDVYIKNFAEALIKGWTGFTYAHLASLVLIEESGIDPEEEIEFDIDTAVFLLEHSQVFDRWVVATSKRLDNFRTTK